MNAPRLQRALRLALSRGGMLLLSWALGAACWAKDVPSALPSFAELEKAGATIGDIVIRNKNIFDTDLPEEDKAIFRAVNALHYGTRTTVIKDALLFASGETVSATRVAETERVLRRSRYLHDVSIVPLAYRDGVVDIEVTTHDTWTLDPGISLSRTGGATSSGIKLKELNLLGTGIALSYGRSRDVDRSSNEIEISDDRAFGGWTQLRYLRANNSDGSRSAVTVAQPFYSLDSTWAAGATASEDDRIDSIYNAGVVASQFRRRENVAEVWGGWSTGRRDGWVQRYSLGFSHRANGYAIEPGRTAPAQLPDNEKLVGPFLRFEVIEDRFERVENRNQIGRAEFFAMGLAAMVQLGRADRQFDSTRDAWLYSGTISRGFNPAPEQTLITSASLSGRYGEGEASRQQLGAKAQYYMPQSRRWLFYASASFDTLRRPEPTESLLLGGDNGLRGYPLRYQSGQHRMLFTLEERGYTDIFLWRLFRIGGAAFVDVGRAWGGDNVNRTNPGWLANVGVGLRIFSVRAAFGNVLHADLAFPLNADAGIDKTQFLVKSRTSF